MSWVPGATGSGFGVEHLPYGVFGYGLSGGHAGVRIGDFVLDLDRAEQAGLLDTGRIFRQDERLDAPLNGFLAEGPAVWRAVRERLTELFTDPATRQHVEPLLMPVDRIWPRMPFEVADYVDFYSSEHHASNVGQILRPGQPPLLPNWKHLPIGYHGRSGTIVVSGTPIARPYGQRKPADAQAPVYGPSTRLDIEAEVGYVVGVGTPLGSRVSTSDLAAHVFGVVLVNDWSARDIQAWEYQPLGPFLGKSFATSVSAWVTPLDALDAAWVAAPVQDPPVLEYLRETDRRGLDLTLAVQWNGTVVSRPPYAGLYWTPAQQLAHLTVNGASLRTGDLFASGTVSGPQRDQTGSFLELTWGGRDPVTLADSSTRTFLADGDTVTIRATAPGPDGTTLTIGEVTGTVQP
ncbi:MAG TPA: fumarylacetoacetase [Micromonosporaceae bacterium]|nr:fumarylacetoacetase [Micromonosporaceae bacterium]